jgi:hypothetical protein
VEGVLPLMCKLRIKGLIAVVLSLSLLTGCLGFNTKTDDGKYHWINVRIYRDTPAWELAKAVYRQDTVKIEKIAKKTPEALDCLDPIYGMTLVRWAVGMEKYEAAKALLKAGADPNKHTYGLTPLYTAAGFSFVDNQAKKDPKYVKLLLEYGADPNIAYQGKPGYNSPQVGTTPLMISIGCGIEKTKALIEAGADINAKTEHSRTAAISALYHGWNATRQGLEYAHYLIVEKKADVTIPYTSHFRNSDPNEKFYPIDLLRYWIYPLDSDEYKIKMEIVEEFARQGVDYWSTEINTDQTSTIKKIYPDTWQEYIEKY